MKYICPQKLCSSPSQQSIIKISFPFQCSYYRFVVTTALKHKQPPLSLYSQNYKRKTQTTAIEFILSEFQKKNTNSTIVTLATDGDNVRRKLLDSMRKSTESTALKELEHFDTRILLGFELILIITSKLYKIIK